MMYFVILGQICGYLAMVCGCVALVGMFAIFAACVVMKAYEKWQEIFWGIENLETYKKDKVAFYRWRQLRRIGGEE